MLGMEEWSSDAGGVKMKKCGWVKKKLFFAYNERAKEDTTKKWPAKMRQGEDTSHNDSYPMEAGRAFKRVIYESRNENERCVGEVSGKDENSKTF